MPTADQHRDPLEAERLLAEMDWLGDDLADLHRSETCPRMRHWLAEQYRKVFGVPPEQGDELRAALERLCEPGQHSVPLGVAGDAG